MTRIPEDIISIYKMEKLSEPELSVVKRIFLNACSEYSKIYILLDALDECEDRFQKSVIQFLDMLNGRADVRILITSRYHLEDIQVAFGQAPQLKLQAKDIDLRQYLSQRIDDDPMAIIIDQEFKSQIIEKIIGNAHGLFLLPALQIQAVLDAPSIGEMAEALESLPITLHEAFDDTLSQVKSLPDGRRQLGMKALMWIFYAKTDRYLRAIDLRGALAVRPGQKTTNSRLQPSTEMIISCCRGLVTVDKATTQLRFIHQAVRDYLQTHEAELFPDGQGPIAELCLTYLMTEPLVEYSCEEEKQLQERVIDTPFLWYAACYWGFHAQNYQTEDMMRQILDLLDSQARRGCVVQIFQYLRGRRKLYWTPH